MSWATLLTAYGDSGRSGLVSRIGSSSGHTKPYSSLLPTTRTRGAIENRRIPSRRLTWEMMLVDSVSAGVCQDAPTKLCAARWTTWVGSAVSSRPRTEARSRRSHSISLICERRCSIFSVRLRHRLDPNTSAPCASAYSAMWLPTKPVIPVMSRRIPRHYTRADETARSIGSGLGAEEQGRPDAGEDDVGRPRRQRGREEIGSGERQGDRVHQPVGYGHHDRHADADRPAAAPGGREGKRDRNQRHDQMDQREGELGVELDQVRPDLMAPVTELRHVGPELQEAHGIG